ncbi:MAG: DNA topoisomerase, partial [Alphaproteobacteria bacterium]
PPFTTSTLQQEAQRKLGFDAARTMQVAQRLYEGIELSGETVGLITYMRTDGVDIEPQALGGIRSVIGADYGDRYLPSTPRRYHAKAKNAQEAHEAIRPTDARRAPGDVARFLDRDQTRLYELIWKRAIASQMESAEMERTTVDIEAIADGKTAFLRANGSVIRFDGFLTLYQEGKDDAEDEESGRLPAMAVGDQPVRRSAEDVKAIESSQHFTEPPPRYTEASLIKKMEELGIGRPSTYASTMAVLRARDYVELDKKRLMPQDKGRLVTAFLESFFERYVQYDFTADLEEKLDRISAGELAWKDVLRDFWRDFNASVDDIKEVRVTQVLDALNEILKDFAFPAPDGGGDPRACPLCEAGQLSLKLGRYGAFIGCSNYPECRFTRQLADPNSANGSAISPDGKELGEDPETGLAIALKSGRFGPYVQLGPDPEKGGEKPRRAGLPKEWGPDEIDLEKALMLLSLPRPVGDHPETGKPITAGLGRYGPFVAHDGQYASLDGIDEVFTVGENRAIALLAEKKSRGGRRNTPAALKELGEHPELGGPVTVRDGRYGPYVNHGKVNATIAKGVKPEDVTMEEAVGMIAEKAAKGGGKTKKKTTRKKAPARKTAAKKPAAKAAKAS